MERSYLIIIYCSLMGFFISCTRSEDSHKVKYAVEPQLERINTASFELEGRQKTFQDSITANWLLGLTGRNPYMTGMFEEDNKDKNLNLPPWSGEFAGKHLTGAIAMYRLNPIPALKQQLDDLVSLLGVLQTPDGYLGPWPKEYELTGRVPSSGGKFADTWDTWNHYHIMIGLLEYNRLFGEPGALEICRRIGDRLCTEFLDQPDKLMMTDKTGGHYGTMHFNLSPSHSLSLLYRATGEDKYLRLAQQIVHEGFLRYGDYLNRALAGKDFYDTEYRDAARWERLHAIMGLAELYWLTGRDDYRKAFEHIWWSIARTDIHNTGGFSTNEKAMGDPYAEGAIETCCVVAWQAMSVEMLKMTGNSIVADMLELAQMNAAYGSWDISGRWCTYHTGSVGERIPSRVFNAFQIRPGTEQLNCCSVNAPRGVGILADWAVMRNGKGLVLNWYGPGTITAGAGGVPVTLTQSTDYPSGGEIMIRVEPTRAVSFPFDLRIPFWSQITTVEINNETIAGVQAGTYMRLDRKWKPGDTIKLTLDMRPHFWPGENQYAGLGSIYHGPVLLAWRKPDETLKVTKKEGEWQIPGQNTSYESNKAGSQLTAEFTSDQASIIYDKHPDGGKTRLLINGKDAGVIDHYAPVSTPSAQWKSPSLKPGRHELIIEVLKDINPASKGTWIRLVRLREFPLQPLPVLDARMLHLSLDQNNPEGVPWLRFTATDAHDRIIELEDFDSAGKNNGYYYTWLPLDGLNKGSFSKSNPLRSIRIE